MRIHSLLLGMAVLFAAGRGRDGVRLLQVGTFHGDEVRAATGERWLSLTKVRDAFRLEPVTLQIDRVHDDVVDDSEKEQSGKTVSIRPELEGIALVRGAGLVPGPVITAGEGISLEPVTEKPIVLGAAHYRIALRCASTPPVDGQKQERCELSMSRGGTTQKLAAFRAYEEQGQREFAAEHPPNVLWAGDLDRDGRLDLLIDTSDHYKVSVISLFLSSRAREGELVGKPVHFSATGC